MKNRIFTYTCSTFFFSLVFTLFQILYSNRVFDQFYGFHPHVYVYLLMASLFVAGIMEGWCYFLPILSKHTGCMYIVIIICNIMLWKLPVYISVYLHMLCIYVSILMAYQLFAYTQANEQLKIIQEKYHTKDAQ